MNLPWTSASRGLTVGDIDRDGDDDIIFVAVDGSLTALENQTSGRSMGASITIRPEAGCDSTGAIVTVLHSTGSYQAPLQRHTYGGAHAPAVVVGTPGPSVGVGVTWPDGTTFEERIETDSSPRTVTVPCPNGADSAGE